MLKHICAPERDILAYEAIEIITQEDYSEHLIPTIIKATKTHGKIRLLIHFGDKFEGFSPGGVWEDTKLGMKYTHLLERCAVVTDRRWIKSFSNFFGSLIPCPVRIFNNDSLDEALAWINSGAIALDYELDSKNGILQLEIKDAFDSSTFEELSHVVDPYIEKKGQLNGLIIHASTFSGWKDIGSFVEHFNFVKEHQNKIKRVALSSDSSFLKLIPSFGDYFLKAQVKEFNYDQLEDARDWINEAS